MKGLKFARFVFGQLNVGYNADVEFPSRYPRSTLDTGNIWRLPNVRRNRRRPEVFLGGRKSLGNPRNG